MRLFRILSTEDELSLDPCCASPWEEVPFGFRELLIGVLLAHFYFGVDSLEFLDELV